MSNWYTKQMSDVTSIRNNYWAKRGIQERFNAGDRVQLNTSVQAATGVIKVYSTGSISEVSEEGYKIKFDNIQEPLFFDVNTTHGCMTAYQEDTVSDVMRTHMTEGYEPEYDIKEGVRVVDPQGRQYCVEKTDPFGQYAMAIDSKGKLQTLAVEQLKIISQDSPLPEETNQTTPLPAGTTVVVTGIDPMFNNYRARAIPANEQAGFVGQQGQIWFSYYPCDGVQMYRVAFERGGKKDFSNAELSQPSNDMGVGVSSLRTTPGSRGY